MRSTSMRTPTYYRLGVVLARDAALAIGGLGGGFVTHGGRSKTAAGETCSKPANRRTSDSAKVCCRTKIHSAPAPTPARGRLRRFRASTPAESQPALHQPRSSHRQPPACGWAPSVSSCPHPLPHPHPRCAPGLGPGSLRRSARSSGRSSRAGRARRVRARRGRRFLGRDCAA
ncbi:MAG: hypothetical protein ACI8QC_003048 [Planctomycetota bacterium]|jgi:hypothetical protein